MKAIQKSLMILNGTRENNSGVACADHIQKPVEHNPCVVPQTTD